MDIEKQRRAKLVDAINHSKILHRWYEKPLKIYDSYAQKDWNQTLLSKINEANKDLGGTIIMTSAYVNEFLNDIDFFESCESSEAMSPLIKTGVLANKFTVYVDFYLAATHLIIAKEDFFTNDNPECAVIYVDGGTFPSL